MKRIVAKWRPSMVLVVMAVCGILLAVPLVAVLALQIGTNRLINETESSLLKQAAIYASAYSAAFEEATQDLGGEVPGSYLAPDKRVFWTAQTRTFQPLLNLRRDVIEAVLPDAVPADTALEIRYRRIAPRLADLAANASRTTLSGVVFLSDQGVDLLAPVPVSFVAAQEVQDALAGNVGAALRWRSGAEDRHSLFSFIRGTGFRVLISYPVIFQNRVIGAIYISRTPQDLGTVLTEDGVAFLLLALATTAGALLVGALLLRTMLRPITALRDQSHLVANGTHSSLQPLAHYGMREIADLGDAVMTMADSLALRRKAIEIHTNHVTHELKSPVTAIIGAAELLQDDALPPEVKQRLQASVMAQGRRMETLLDQLREMTRARLHEAGPPGELSEMTPGLPGIEIRLKASDPKIPLSRAHGETILIHMAQNARNHGASQLDLKWDGKTLRLSDNGAGFGEAHLDRLTDPFYTTRREQGGTGFGLAIVVALLDLYGARLTPIKTMGGAVFEIDFGKAA
jgi:signal transduction histidine kinase